MTTCQPPYLCSIRWLCCRSLLRLTSSLLRPLLVSVTASVLSVSASVLRLRWRPGWRLVCAGGGCGRTLPSRTNKDRLKGGSASTSRPGGAALLPLGGGAWRRWGRGRGGVRVTSGGRASLVRTPSALCRGGHWSGCAPAAPHGGCGDAYVCACAVAASPQLSHWQEGRPGRAAGCAGLAAGNYNVETRLIVYCVHTAHCVMCGGGSTRGCWGPRRRAHAPHCAMSFQ